MRQALALAERGLGRVAPNPLVGCVLVKDGTIVGQGYHRRYGGRHAEVEALAAAGQKACGATMYVTLQPCNHVGKTPPCTDAIIAAGVKRVVFATCDPNPGSDCKRGTDKLVDSGIEVSVGICRDEAERLNDIYFHRLRTSRPFVALKLAATLDGKIADFQGRSQWITSDEARQEVHRLRSAYDAILVGSRTVETDDPRLTSRVPGCRSPVRLVLDADLSLSPRAQVLRG
ncbi:MAG: bifunctional diaminohydroxyphosphoribosylaminopyrimidine deaminase/5-amino-6-(5-phosphoribosylamino)uracil reductase RibD, partial [candidate division WOR-3 bacterium]